MAVIVPIKETSCLKWNSDCKCP